MGSSKYRDGPKGGGDSRLGEICATKKIDLYFGNDFNNDEDDVKIQKVNFSVLKRPFLYVYVPTYFKLVRELASLQEDVH